MIYIFVISNRISRNLSKCASKKYPAHSVFGTKRAGSFTLRFREVPARAELLSALSFFAQPLD
jgi:hypothetical protein